MKHPAQSALEFLLRLHQRHHPDVATAKQAGAYLEALTRVDDNDSEPVEVAEVTSLGLGKIAE